MAWREQSGEARKAAQLTGEKEERAVKADGKVTSRVPDQAGKGWRRE